MTLRTSAKERLTDAAFTLFEERGFEATTVDDIAERAGVGRTTFFRTFRSKEDAIFPDHESLAADVVDRLSVADAGDGADTARRAVLDATCLVLEHYLSEGDRARQRYQLTRAVPSLRDREHAGVRRHTRAFVEFGERVLGTDDGGLRAELFGTSLVTAHNHVLRRWLRRETADPMAELRAAVGLVCDLLLGLGQLPTVEAPAGGQQSAQVAVVVVRSDEDVALLAERIRRAVS